MEIQEQDNLRQAENQTSAPVSFQEKQSPDNMATASLVMGILGTVTCCCYYSAFIFGGLGILFALLSRTESHLSGKAKAGLGLSIAGIVLLVVFWIGFFLLINSAGSFYNESPIKNLPAVPDFTQPGLDNFLTILRFPLTGGGFR